MIYSTQKIIANNVEGQIVDSTEILITNQLDYTPKVSVIIPAYNVAEYLRKCLDTVLNQTLKEIEIICVDDGSTDGSLEILKKYAEKDKRITLISRENKGVGYSRNQGINCSKGRFISFMDPDDYYPSLDILETMFNKAVEHNVQICGGSLIIYNETNKKEKKRTSGYSYFNVNTLIPYSEYQFDYGFQRFIYDRKLIIDNGIYFPNYRRFQDPPFMVKAFITAKNFYALSDYVYAYRWAHKKVSWTEEKIYHMLQGVRDNLILSYNAKLDDLWERSLLHIQKEYKQCLSEFSSKRIEQIKGEIMKLCLDYAKNKYSNSTSKPLISVIIPIYNVESYLRECLDSVIGQTLKDIEIICVNDGSTDESLNIIKEYANKDSRIKYIDKPNAGYGHTMNCGLELATGEYISLVESDDYILPDMYETLYTKALEHDADIIKSDFKRFYGEGKNRVFEYRAISSQKNLYDTVTNTLQTPELLRVNNVNCNGLFKRDFIQQNHIRFNETPGASFQDNGFWFQTFCLAKRIYLMTQPFYMIRRDNPNSSVKSKSKVYCACDEYEFIAEFLNRHPDFPLSIRKMYHKAKYDIYSFTYGRIADEFKLEFLERFGRDFSEPLNQGFISAPEFTDNEIKKITRIVTDPREYHLNTKNISHEKSPKKTNKVKTYLFFPYYMWKLAKSTNRKDSILIESTMNKYRRNLQTWYRKVTGKDPNLDNPQTFNEKIQWLKLYDATPIKTKLADKYLVREWVKDKIGEKYLIPLLGVYDKFEDIDFNKLPDCFVIKCNHGSGYNIIVKDKSHLDLENTKNKLHKWMHENYAFKYGCELHYRDIKPKIVIEKYLSEIKDSLYDYRFFCFNGKVRQIWLDINSGTPEHKRKIYDNDWNELDVIVRWPRLESNIPKPDNLDKMIELSEAMAEGFALVRVDFYRMDDGTIYFGEMTFTSMSGIGQFEPASEDKRLGSLIRLPELAYNIDAKKYYNISKPNKLISFLHSIKPYLFLPYYIKKRSQLRKQYEIMVTEQIVNNIAMMRIDIKNIGTAQNALSIEAEGAKISKPTWFSNNQGIGQIIESSKLKQKINITIIRDGKLTLRFRGCDCRHDGERLPLWIDYESIIIDGKKVLPSSISVWHDKPFYHELLVHDGQTVTLEVEQAYHAYNQEELEDIILKHNPRSSYFYTNYINSHIKKILYNVEQIIAHI